MLQVSCRVSCPIGPRLHFLLQVSCIGFQYTHRMTSKENNCFMNSVASKTPRKIRNIEILNKLSIYESTTIFHYPTKRASNLSILAHIHKPQPETSNYFQFHSSVVVLCHIKNRSVDFTKQAKALPLPLYTVVVGGAQNSTSLNGGVAVV